MGSSMSQVEFDAVTAPILERKRPPPAWFKPQKLVQFVTNIGEVTTAFLSDGTIAGSVAWNEKKPLSLRGIYIVDETAGIVTTHAELSLRHGAASRHHHHHHHSRSSKSVCCIAVDKETGLLLPRGGKPSRTKKDGDVVATDRKTNDDADVDYGEDDCKVVVIAADATAGDFLSSCETSNNDASSSSRHQSQSGNEEQRRQQNSSYTIHEGGGGDGEASFDDDDDDPASVAMAIAMQAMISQLGVPPPAEMPQELIEFVHTQQAQQGGSNSSSSAASTALKYTAAMLNHSSMMPTLPPQIAAMMAQQKQQRRQQQQEAEDELLVARQREQMMAGGGGGGGDLSVASSATEQQQRSLLLQLGGRRRKPLTLFERLGFSYQIPTDERRLKEIFSTFDKNGSGFISREEFCREYQEFEREFGVDLEQKDMEAVFRRFDRNRDSKMSFAEFQLFMLHRAKC